MNAVIATKSPDPVIGCMTISLSDHVTAFERFCHLIGDTELSFK